jgi:hypothetical protein
LQLKSTFTRNHSPHRWVCAARRNAIPPGTADVHQAHATRHGRLDKDDRIFRHEGEAQAGHDNALDPILIGWAWTLANGMVSARSNGWPGGQMAI